MELCPENAAGRRNGGGGAGGLSPKQSLHPRLYQNGVSILWGNDVFCKVRNLPRCSEGVTSVPIQEYTIGCCPENNVEVEMKAPPPRQCLK